MSRPNGASNRVRAEQLREIDEWIAPYWSERLDALEHHLDARKET